MTAELRNAGIVSRFVAAMIDGLVVLGFQVGVYLAIALVRLVLSVRAFTLPDYAWVWGTTSFIAIAIAYLTLSWAAFGRTFGQLVMGVAVVSRGTGRKPKLVRALGRAALSAFVPVGLFWVVVSPRRWSLSDLVCFTRVVYTHDVLPDHSPVSGSIPA
ncbi:RDD family protein [Gordonia sp. PP30]|uniref:RDD family protein n=1 Tax=Gordonia sp. PP30 TaxID=2935861 RepID=UPI001FFF879D|nr:RDD family protein [Gordonia sp. PP30]UQE75823.1 RDD family protein [Gordonia sp. PP30]